jgi:outer membrane protein
MKNKIILVCCFLISTISMNAQKFAYVDTDYILSKIPEFSQSEEQINKYSKQWNDEIEAGYKEIEQMFQDYQSEEILLDESLKIKRQESIIEKEKYVQSLQQKYFGSEGELYKKRQELISPIQDRIFDAIQQLAANNKYSIIFDASSDLIMLYSNPDLDKSDKILQIMGY